MNQGVIFKYDIAFLTLVFPLPNSRILQVYQADFDLRLHFCIFSKWEVYKSSLQWGLTPGVLISDLESVHTISPSRPKEGIHQRHYLLFSRSHETGTSNEKFWQLLWQMGPSMFTTYQYRVLFLNSVKNKYILQESAHRMGLQCD